MTSRSKSHARSWQQLITTFLALCVAAGGVIGLSPTLHHWIEHGGEGDAHTHAGWRKSNRNVHAHPHPHSHHPHEHTTRSATEASRESWRAQFQSQNQRLTLFGWEVRDVYHALGWLLTQAFGVTPVERADDSDGHTHQSLPQMLLSGAIEGTACGHPVFVPPHSFRCLVAIADSFVAASELDAQTAPRGPPSLA